jgi:ACS family hexuronate transporter-like MFS transporter
LRLLSKLRWLAVSVFVLSSTLNYLDRYILNAVAPLVLSEFHLTQTDFGFVIGVASLAYALTAPVMGYLLDRLGLNRGVSFLVACWSLAGAATSFTRSLGGLMGCRIALGVFESGGVAAVAKASAMYLPAEERALGSAIGQIGLSAGGILAPVVGTWLALTYGWRRPFLVTGALGLLWIPLWLAVSRRVRPAFEPKAPPAGIIRDWRLIVVLFSNVLWMGLYSLWFNWTTLYLVNVHHLKLADAAKYSWIPPMASNLGAFFGGGLALRWIPKGGDPLRARMRVILISALGALLTLAVPIAPTPGWAMLAISVSFFWVLAGNVNIYTIPVDLFGPERAAFAISSLTFAYGLMQTVVSPGIGYLVEHQGYGPVCWILSGTPLAAWALLTTIERASVAKTGGG